MRRRRVLWLVVVALLVALVAVGEQGSDSRLSALPERYQQWLKDVDLLLSDAEREVFLALGENYQRDHFIRQFWKVRDPFPRTARNEFQERWMERAAQARELFQDDPGGERLEMLFKIGAPKRFEHPICSEHLAPLEVWHYDDGADRIRGYFTLVFHGQRSRGRGRHTLWQPTDGLTRLVISGRLLGATDLQIAKLIAANCIRGDQILAALAQSLDLSRIRDDMLLPQPSDEWVLTFQARSTDVDEDAEPLSGRLELSFPGRNQSRTVVQGVVAVPAAEATASQLGDYRSYNLLIDGEILRQGELFDHFRYRFDFPEKAVGEEIPLVIQRYLRPGPYELIVKVEDMGSGRVYREVRTVQVPRVKRQPQMAMGTPPPSAPVLPPARGQPVPAPSAARPGTRMEVPSIDGVAASAVGMRDTLTSAALGAAAQIAPSPYHPKLAEANASISTGDHAIEILPLPDVLTVGKLRVHARARGAGIARVAFALNGQTLMRKSKPPYSVELDLGDKPRTHTLQAIALDERGKSLAVDEVMINAGPHRFAVRLLEPQRGKIYYASVRAHAEVEVPEGEKLERVEFFLNDDRVATLYQPPFEQPILLGEEGAEMTYVRAVAYLRGGNATEDVRIINAPDFIDETQVQFVELYTTVTGRQGNFVEGLSVDEFTVLEEGVEQKIRRFETMRDLPMRAGLVLDTSLSMLSSLSHVKKAAHQFFERVLTPRDRAALMTFNDVPQLVVPFTNDQEVLAGGLAGLVAEGETALHDSIIAALHYFSGIRGKRAIVVLTDGEDSTSTYSYGDAIEFARHTGVAVYVVGLRLHAQKSDIRLRMQRLASETGGECFFIDSASQLDRIYDRIQEELRSQYLIAYQSSLDDGGEAFRRVEVKTRTRGLEAKTIRGYYP